MIVFAVFFNIAKYLLKTPKEEEKFSFSVTDDAPIKFEYPPYTPPKPLIPPYLCPYCQVEFPTEPKRKRKCPSCKETVYIEYSEDDPLKQKYLMKEEDVLAIREERNWESLPDIADRFSLSRNRISQEIKMLREKNFSFKDVQWSIYNFIANELIKKSSYGDLSSLYYTMAITVYDQGKDPNTLLQKSSEMELHSLKKDFPEVKRVSILATDDSCPACKELSEKTLTIDQAIKQKLLPVKHCSRPLHKKESRPFCRCTYTPDIK
jgi:biotin operon repressor